jgi:hypothetical protein
LFIFTNLHSLVKPKKMKFSLIAILGLFTAGSFADFTQIPGCPVNIPQYFSPACLKEIQLLNSTTGPDNQLTSSQAKDVCTSCSKDISAISKALSSSGNPICAANAPVAQLYCQTNAAGDYCLSTIASPTFGSINQGLFTTVFSGGVLSAEQCKSVDCCSYELFSALSAVGGDAPNNPNKKLVAALDSCTVSVPKTCAPATIILS